MSTSSGMTFNQAAWSASHDWHLKTVKLNDGTFQVIVKDDMQEGEQLAFTNCEALYNWAGY